VSATAHRSRRYRARVAPRDASRGLGAAAQQLNELRAENHELERRAKELQTPEAAIREARALGLVGEGEQAYKVEGLE
jgi:cell division protein FtsB